MDTEMKVKKRDWVKNAAIIFLAVMLALTFFSNTIMNRSLPEVAAQNVISGEITSKVRGTGNVTANQSYEVTLPQTREIKTVRVKQGDEVKEGDILFTLTSAQSSELRTAQDTLRQLNLAYNKALINATQGDYAKNNLDIQRAKEDLQTAQAKQEKLPFADSTSIAAAQSALEKAQAKVTKAQKRVDEIGDVSTDTGSGSGSSAQLSAAQSKLTNDLTVYGGDYQELLKLVVADRIDAASAAAGKTADTGTGALKDAYVDYYYALLFGDSASKDAIATMTHGNPDLDAIRIQFEKDNPDYTVANYLKTAATAGYSGNDGSTIKANYNQAKAYNILSQDAAAVAAAKNAVANDNNYTQNATAAQKEAAKNLKLAQAELDSAKAVLENLNAQKTAYDAAAAEAKTAQRALEDLVLTLNTQKKTDGKAQALEKLDLKDMKAQIASQQAVIGDIAKNSTETDIKAKVGGIMKTVDAVAGKSYDGGATLATITLPDQGYCVSFSVTKDQARRVHAGDAGTISNYYDNSVTATLQTIKADPNAPTTSMILVFNITGDVSEGTSLTISAGEQSAQYDAIVPNSSIRSDSNGDFVLAVVSKSSPLGNRYIATRVDIKKVASDEKNTAVSGALSPSDYVITTSSKPVNNKDRVKLAD